jgi:hypothetical protein
MPDSEFQQYGAFVSRTLSEVQKGLELDNCRDGSRKHRVHATLAKWNGPEGAASKGRSPAQRVIDSRFILGGDDASYLANGLALLWSSVGEPCKGGESELGLAPAALYSPDAVNGIRRGLLAAFEKKNEAMRKDAPNQLASLMAALVPIVPFVYDAKGGRDDMHEFLKTGLIENTEQRNKLFEFLVLTRRDLDKNGPDGRDVPASSLAFQILAKAKEAHGSAVETMKAEHERLKKECEDEIATCYALLKKTNAEWTASRQERESWRSKHNALLVAHRRAEATVKGLAREVHDGERERDNLHAELDSALTDAQNRWAAHNRLRKDYEELLRGAREMRKRCEEEIDALQEELGDKDALIANTSEQADALREQHDGCRAEREALLAERLAEQTRSTRAIEELETQLRDEQSKYQETEKKRQKALAELQRTSVELAERQRALRECERAGKELEQRERAQKRTTQGLAQRVWFLTIRRTTLTRELNQMRARQGATEQQRLDAVAELRSVSAELADQQQALGAADARCTEEVERVTEGLEAMIDAKTQKILSNITDHADQLQELRQNHEAQLAALRDGVANGQQDQGAQIAALRADYEGQIADLASRFEQERAEWAQRMETLAAERDAARARGDNLDTELAQATQARDECELRVIECMTRLSEAQAAADAAAQAHREEKAGLLAEKADSQRQNAELLTERAQTQEEISDLWEQNADLLTERVQTEQEIENLREERGGAGLSLPACEEKLELVRAAAETATAALNEANQRVLDCEAARDEARGNFETAQRELGAIRERMQRMWNELSSEFVEAKQSKANGEAAKIAAEKAQQAAQNAGDAATVNTLAQEIEELQRNINTFYDRETELAEWLKSLAQLATGVEPDAYELYKKIDGEEPYVDFIDTRGLASDDGAWVSTAVYRGLVGQRGPTEPADVAHCPQDALLPYALPKIDEVVKHLLPAHMLLQSTPDPTDEEVGRAMAALSACKRGDGAKRQRVDDLASPAVSSEALALFQDDFAITSTSPAAELPAERCGVELPHEARWMPQGPRAATMARVAVLEHAVARCGQLAAAPDVRTSVAAALRRAATALKLQQLAPLYELHEAVECDDCPHPLGTGATRLVTRPCAIVRGTLSFPSQPGVAPLAESSSGSATPLTHDATLAQAMSKTAAATATLRNGLRRRGLASNVYVAPEPQELAFCSAPTGAAEARVRSEDVPLVGLITQARKLANSADDANLQFAEGNPVAAIRAQCTVAWRDVAGRGLTEQQRAEHTRRLQRMVRELTDAMQTAGRKTPLSAPVTSDPAAAPAPVTSARVSPDMYRDETFSRIINRLIVCAAANDLGEGHDPKELDPVAAFLDVAKDPKDGAGAVTPQTRRAGLWAEMQRHVAVSQDRLWVFVRLMGGKIGGNASEVITLADEATLKAAKAIQEQRAEIAKRVSDMQSKIVETVVSSMLKNSKMTMEYKESNLAVIDAEARKELKDLETGASGRPFFEANVALKNLANPKEGPPALKDVLSGLANVGEQMQSALERTLAEPNAASASLVELSHPANAYFVMMRGDALAAIRAAQEKLNCELGAEGARRRLSTWELIEGGCTVLTDRFAELCGYLLVQARTSTGVSAMYVSHQSIYTNVSQARVALARLTAAAHAYLASVPPPAFDSDDPKEARCIAMTQGERVRDIDITQRRVTGGRVPLHAPVPSSGWWATGLKRW